MSNDNSNDSKSSLVLLSGSSNPLLSKSISNQLGIPLTPVTIESYPCGELHIELPNSIRNRSVYILQSGYIPNFTNSALISSFSTPNDLLIELIFLAETCLQASAQAIHLVFPCMPYIIPAEESETLPPGKDLKNIDKNDSEYHDQDQDQTFLSNRLEQQGILCEAQTATQAQTPLDNGNIYFNPLKLIADLICSTNPRSILTLSLPVPQYHGFFNVPLDDLSIIPLFTKYFKSKKDKLPGYIIGTCDLSCAKRASKLSTALEASFVLLHNTDNENDFILSGDDVYDRDVLIFSDYADICTKFCRAAQFLLNKSVATVSLLITHFLPPDHDEFEKLHHFSKIFLTNSVQLPDSLIAKSDKFEIIDISEYLARAINLHHTGGSLKHLQDTFSACP